MLAKGQPNDRSRLLNGCLRGSDDSYEQDRKWRGGGRLPVDAGTIGDVIALRRFFHMRPNMAVATSRSAGDAATGTGQVQPDDRRPRIVISMCTGTGLATMVGTSRTPMLHLPRLATTGHVRRTPRSDCRFAPRSQDEWRPTAHETKRLAGSCPKAAEEPTKAGCKAATAQVGTSAARMGGAQRRHRLKEVRAAGPITITPITLRNYVLYLLLTLLRHAEWDHRHRLTGS